MSVSTSDLNLPKLTLDRNVLISIENKEAGYEAAQKIILAHQKNLVSIGISSANRVENNLEKKDILSPEEIARFCAAVHLYNPEMLDYPLDWNFGLWESGFIGKDTYELEVKIHTLLFPNVPNSFSAQENNTSRRKIRNAKCDVFAIWGHIYFSRDFFITNDENFLSKTHKEGLEMLGAKGIMRPRDFVSLIQN